MDEGKVSLVNDGQSEINVMPISLHVYLCDHLYNQLVFNNVYMYVCVSLNPVDVSVGIRLKRPRFALAFYTERADVVVDLQQLRRFRPMSNSA